MGNILSYTWDHSGGPNENVKPLATLYVQVDDKLLEECSVDGMTKDVAYKVVVDELQEVLEKRGKRW